MCGIAGVFSDQKGGFPKDCNIDAAVHAMNRRGPDAQASLKMDNVHLGHSRLAVIDTNSHANQPFSSPDGRYHLVFNGEIYNHESLRKQLNLPTQGFQTTSDTESLLYWLIEKGVEGLSELNGFFAFCFYDTKKNEALLARDRFGIKPLMIYEKDDYVAFSSEMKAMFKLGIDREIDVDALGLYLKFNYLPEDYSMIKNVRKVRPGRYLLYSGNQKIDEKTYYLIPGQEAEVSKDSYDQAQEKVRKLLYESVEDRLISDVPLGTFLSGGIDSSIITAIASEIKGGINSYSIGFEDEPLFDETHYAELVANKYKTNHTVFKIKNQDLFDELEDFLSYTCEPFADSSALAVNLLCKKTSQDLTVALSGDGADELFSGYHKHMAELRMRKGGVASSVVKAGGKVWSSLPKSRNSAFGNKIRQMDKYAKAGRLSNEERYWNWAGNMTDVDVESITLATVNMDQLQREIMKNYSLSGDMNSFLRADMQWVLPNDMLTKVDKYSMANSLEVRVPFLDHRLVDYVSSLPEEYKIVKKQKKRILQDAFRSKLPEELYNRPKHGFEVPLLKWFRGELWEKIDKHYLSRDLILEQGLFNWNAIELLKQRIHSKDPGEGVANLWALIVFQHWWLKFMQKSN